MTRAEQRTVVAHVKAHAKRLKALEASGVFNVVVTIRIGASGKTIAEASSNLMDNLDGLRHAFLHSDTLDKLRDEIPGITVVWK